MPTGSPYILTDRVFGHLTVVKFAGKLANGTWTWECMCDCGEHRVVRSTRLVNGEVSTCQKCFGRERHGKSNTPEYQSWAHAKDRCYNRKSKDWKNYGARGITMSKEWRISFSAFFADLGPKPSSEHSLERSDVNGNYCKENCRWATAIEQNQNRRSNAMVEYNGFLVCFAAVCELHDMPYSQAYNAYMYTDRSLEEVIRRFANQGFVRAPKSRVSHESRLDR